MHIHFAFACCTYIASADDLLLASVGHHYLHFPTDHVSEVGLGTELDALGHGSSDRSRHALSPMEAFEGLEVMERTRSID